MTIGENYGIIKAACRIRFRPRRPTINGKSVVRRRRPAVGTIPPSVDGRDVTAMSDEELAAYRGLKLGFVFQEYNLLDTLTVYENIVLPLTLRGTRRSEADARTRDIMESFGITQLRDKFPGELSGGERQRTACARALVGQPSLIIADEPTGALGAALPQKPYFCFSRKFRIHCDEIRPRLAAGVFILAGE